MTILHAFVVTGPYYNAPLAELVQDLMLKKNETINTASNDKIKNRIRNVRDGICNVLTDLKGLDGEAHQGVTENLLEIVKKDQSPETRHLRKLIEEQFDPDYSPAIVNEEIATSVRVSIAAASQGDSVNHGVTSSPVKDPRKENLKKNNGKYPSSSSGGQSNDRKSRV